MEKPKEHEAEGKIMLEVLIQVRATHNDVMVRATGSSMREFFITIGLLEQVKLKMLARIEEMGKKTGDFTEHDLNKPLEN